MHENVALTELIEEAVEFGRVPPPRGRLLPMSACLPQVRTRLCQAVQKLGQDLVRRNQVRLSQRLSGANRLAAVLIVRMKYAPVQRVCEEQPHFFFGAPWR